MPIGWGCVRLIQAFGDREQRDSVASSCQEYCPKTYAPPGWCWASWLSLQPTRLQLKKVKNVCVDVARLYGIDSHRVRVIRVGVVFSDVVLMLRWCWWFALICANNPVPSRAIWFVASVLTQRLGFGSFAARYGTYFCFGGLKPGVSEIIVFYWLFVDFVYWLKWFPCWLCIGFHFYCCFSDCS